MALGSRLKVRALRPRLAGLQPVRRTADHHAMRVVPNPFLRGLSATMVATAVVAVEESIRRLPELLSPSSPPADPFAVVVTLPCLGLFLGLVLAVWTVPVNSIVYWVMRRRRVTRLAPVVTVALLACLAVAGTILWPFTLAASGSPEVFMAILGVVALASLFILAWFVTCGIMTPRIPGPDPVPVPPASQRVLRTSVETLSIVGVLGWSVVAGAVVLFVVALGAGSDYQAQSSALSPDGATRAWNVDYSWGGAAGGIREQVYLLPATRPWNPQKRGLLVWEARHANTPQLAWESPKQLVVRVPVARSEHRPLRAETFSRSGYVVRSETVRTDSL